MRNHRQGLRIVDDDEVMAFYMVSNRILIDHIFVDLHFHFGQVEIPAL